MFIYALRRALVKSVKYPISIPPKTFYVKTLIMRETTDGGAHKFIGVGENACQRLISAVFGARIGNLTENLGKMGKIVLRNKPL